MSSAGPLLIETITHADPALRDRSARELAAGWSTTALAQTLSGLAPDPRVLSSNAGQPEFATPVGVYVQHRVTASTVALGRRKRDGVAEPGTRRRSSAAVAGSYGEQRTEESAWRRQPACAAVATQTKWSPLSRRSS